MHARMEKEDMSTCWLPSSRQSLFPSLHQEDTPFTKPFSPPLVGLDAVAAPDAAPGPAESMEELSRPCDWRNGSTVEVSLRPRAS
jgi:hypothetical protein